MTAIYINGLNIQMNEVAFLQFNLNDQNGLTPVIKICTNYEFLEQIHSAIGGCLAQHKAKLNYVVAEGRGKGN